MDRNEAAFIVGHASMIGQILEQNHPHRDDGVQRGIAAEDVDDVADVISLVVAQILQSFLDAGSERENTMEEIGPAIRDHVQSWVI